MSSLLVVGSLLAALLPAAAPAPVTVAESAGMTLEQIAELRAVRSADVSPDGKLVAYTLQVQRDLYGDEDGGAWSELHVAGPKRGQHRAFITGEVNIGHVRWTPDGRHIAYLAKRDGEKHKSLYLIAVDGGESRKVATHDEGISGYVFSPGGERVAFLGTAAEDDLTKKKGDKGFTAEVFEEVDRPTHVWVVDLAADGTVVTTKEARRLELPGSASELQWSPRGDHLAVALAPTGRVDDHYMRRKLKVVHVDKGEVVASIDNPGKLGPVRWSPDGNWLAFISAADYNDPRDGRLMIAPATGGEPRDLFPDFLGHVRAAEWSGTTTLTFIAHQDVQSWLGRLDVRGGGIKQVITRGGPILQSLSLSNDGKRMALLADSPHHPTELFVFGKGARKLERWTDSNPWLATVKLAPQEAVTWRARDGLEIQGILIRPLDAAPGARSPLIVIVHGGPESHFANGWVTRYATPGQVAAGRGYAVLYPNYRGSTGRGVAFSKLDQADYAGAEFDDLVDGVEHLGKTGLVDKARVGVTGGSYGGFASAWCATALTEHFAASVMFVGISDQISKFGTTDIPEEMHAVHSRKWPWEDWDWFRERSPIYHTEKARTPILILHGKDDPRVPPSQSMELYRYLHTMGKVPVRLVLYPGEGHGNRKAAARYDLSARLMRWMDHYLVGSGGDPPPHELPLDRDKLGVKDDAEADKADAQAAPAQ